MRKKFLLFLLTLILFVQLALPINAAATTEPSVTVLSGYYLNDIVHSFIQKNTDKPLSKMEFTLDINNGYSSGEGYVSDAIGESDNPVSYMLLIDLSTSMPGYRDRVSSFAGSLIQSGNNETKFSVASFGERFELVAKDITRTDELMATIDGLQYDQNATDICGGVNKALKYLSNAEREEGELVNMVLITDGVPYLPDSIENHQQIIESSAKKTKKLLSKTSDVLVHSLGFGTWDTTTIDAVSAGCGLHTMAYSPYEAQSAAAEIAEYIGSLYRIEFPVSISDNMERFNSNLRIKFKNKSLIESIKEKSIVNLNALYKKNSGKKFDSQPIIVSRTKKPKKKKPAEEETTVATEQETTEATEEESTEEVEEDIKETSGNRLFVPILIASAVVLAAVLAAVILLVINSAKKPHRKSGPGIKMRLEVIRGNCRNNKNVVALYDELIIGRRSSCDIVFDDKSVAHRNTRIYITNNIIYIENIGSETNTAIGGMKIYSPNRLRSGDEISVGNVVFRLLF